MRACGAIERLEDPRSTRTRAVLGAMASGMALVLSGAGRPGHRTVRAVGVVPGGPQRRVGRPVPPSHADPGVALAARDRPGRATQVNEAIVRPPRARRARLTPPPADDDRTGQRHRRPVGRTPRRATSRRSGWPARPARAPTSPSASPAWPCSTRDVAAARSAARTSRRPRGRPPQQHQDGRRSGWSSRRATSRQARGDTATAVRHYQALEAGLAATGLADPDQSCAPELVEAYVHLGRADEAAKLAAGFVDKAAAKGQPWSLARSERALGICAPDDAAEGPLPAGARAACADSRPLRDRAHRAGLRLPAAPGPEAGRGPAPAPVRARDLRAARCRPRGRTRRRPSWRRPARPYAAARQRDGRATPQERQIAQMLAAGRTTRRGRGRAVHQPEDRGVPPAARLPEARHPLPRRARRAVRLGGAGLDMITYQ